MKKHFFFFIAFIFCFLPSEAQTFFGGGYSPIGRSWITFRYSDIKDYDNGNNFHSNLIYDNYYNGHIFGEVGGNGTSIMVEASMAQAKLTSFQGSTKANITPSDYSLMKITSAYIYLGRTINSKKRFQFPIYVGAGGNLIKTAPIQYLVMSLSGKAKMQIYVLKKVALYGGIAYDAGISSFRAGLVGSIDPSYNLAVRYHTAHFDGGLLFTF